MGLRGPRPATLALGGLLASEEQSAIIGLAALGDRPRRHGPPVARVLRWLLVVAVVAGLLFGATRQASVRGAVRGARSSTELPSSRRRCNSAGRSGRASTSRAIEQRPLTGYGDVTPLSVRWPYTESQYVTLLMQGGLPLLLLFAALTWAMAPGRGRACARSPDFMDQALGRGAW